MSQSPDSLAASLADEKQAYRYRRGWKALSELIGQGKSFSGHEKNTCFLNLGDGRFADVSSATGLDFDDDGRALAVCDWDHDGRQDFWVTNRTAPRVRLLRNAGKGGNWIALRLQGTTCNRDAIGARIEVVLKNGEFRTKSVRAGDGFLAQSSKWVHFGLGDQQIRAVHIRWPGPGTGDRRETITHVRLNTFQQIVEGRGEAEEWKTPLPDRLALGPAPLPEPDEELPMRTWLIGRIPLPELPGLPAPDGKPRLISLWSQTCDLCQHELAEWARHASDFRDAGLAGVVYSVDPLLGEEAMPPPGNLPFDHRTASRELADALDFFHRTFVERQDPLPLPTTFLLDQEGRVAVIYKGPVESAALLDDLRLLGENEHRVRDAAVPFSGRWASNLFPPQPERLAEAFAAAGYPEWRDRYLSNYLANYPDAARSVDSAGQLLKEGRTNEAVALLAELVTSAPSDHEQHRRSGVLLLQHNVFEPARTHLALALPGFRNDADFRFNLGIAEASNRNAAGALENFRAAAALNPQDAAAQFQIANVLHATKRTKDALVAYRKALALRPGWHLPANNLAWILATHQDATLRDGAEAVSLMTTIIETNGGKNPTTLSTMAAALAESGDYPRAIETAREALTMAERANDARTAQSLKAALKLYEASQPMRSR